MLCEDWYGETTAYTQAGGKKMNTALGSDQARKRMIVVAALIILVIAGYIVIRVNLPAIEPSLSTTRSTSASGEEVGESGLMDSWLYAAQAESLAEANALVDSWLYALTQEAPQHAPDTYVMSDGWLYAAVGEAQD
jgi:hypothetical protein